MSLEKLPAKLYNVICGVDNMNKRKFLSKLKNNQKNVRFGDFIVLIEAFGFEQIRVKGSHQIYERPDVFDMVNVQNDGGQAKPYQIRQFLNLIKKYNLRLEGE